MEKNLKKLSIICFIAGTLCFIIALILSTNSSIPYLLAMMLWIASIILIRIQMEIKKKE
ncbi:hypothetical protein [Floccifex sp.]|uniref:hypothetical protein n=1 Tax=Floccifex sp. TaxID=2815810 RepID=UPI003EFE19C6